MLASYEELRQVDVRPYCEPRDGYLYLNWARCIDLLHEYGAEKAYFEPIPNPATGGSLYWTDIEFADKNNKINRCYETRIKIVIDDKEFVMQTPVINGANPVKDNSMDQLRVWSSMCRSFVKGVAIHTGLGFDLWLKEEEKTLETVPTASEELATAPQKKVIKDTCKAHKVDLDAWLTREGTTLEKLTATQAALMIRAFNGRGWGDESGEQGEAGGDQ